MNFLFLIRNWKWLLGGLVILSIGGWIALLKVQLHFAEKGRHLAEAEATQWQQTADQYLQANIESQAAFEEYKKQILAWQVTAQQQIEATSRQIKLSQQIRKEIANAPEADNRPLGPILNFTIECLRQFQAGATSCRH